MTFVIHGNLDVESTWTGLALPAAVAQRIAAAAALLAALAPGADDVEVWAPAAVDRGRLVGAPGFVPPAMRVGAPPRADLGWADPGARAMNDRRLALAVASELGCALPGARAIGSVAELTAHLAAGGAAASERQRWVCKAAWTAAGRDRCFGEGGAPRADQATRIERLIAAAGAVVFEPWLDRVLDVGATGVVGATGAVDTSPPHVLLADARGGFVGIQLAPPPALTASERAQLERTVAAVGAALAARGYRGPFGIDGFVYRDGGGRALHPLCEINARHTFGHVARALGRRLGRSVLGFGPPAAGATVLIAPASGDPLCAWMA